MAGVILGVSKEVSTFWRFIEAEVFSEGSLWICDSCLLCPVDVFTSCWDSFRAWDVYDR